VKLLITGGSGFIGRNLTRIFREQGYDVLAPTRSELDMRDLEGLRAYLRTARVDATIHCAAVGVFNDPNQSFNDIYCANIEMFENLMVAGSNQDPIILIGSGAEFDRRWPIIEKRESDVYVEWPIDAYGLSKNIITRRIKNNMRVLRSFGCFNHDEPMSRFIRQSLHRIKQGLPISIVRNRRMDFFYLDDMATAIKYTLKSYHPQHLNLVYKEKHDLISIAHKIYKHAGVKDYPEIMVPPDFQNEYTGCGVILDNLRLPLIGLDEGIKKTIQQLL